MLVATPGHTTSYPLHGGVKKTCRDSSATPKNPNNLKLHKSARAGANKLPQPASSASNTASALMKTLSVRLNRGNEFIKHAVQKAFNANANAVGHCTTATSNRHTGTTASSTAGILPASSFLKLYTVPPTVTHRYPDERHLASSSADSLNKEMCHFKPIRSVPITPWKCTSKSRGPTLKTPKPNLASTMRTRMNCDDSMVGIEANAGTKSDLSAPMPSSDIFTKMFTHRSAFVYLVSNIKKTSQAANSKINKAKFKGKPKVKTFKRARKPTNTVPAASYAEENESSSRHDSHTSLMSEASELVQEECDNGASSDEEVDVTNHYLRSSMGSITDESLSPSEPPNKNSMATKRQSRKRPARSQPRTKATAVKANQKSAGRKARAHSSPKAQGKSKKTPRGKAGADSIQLFANAPLTRSRLRQMMENELLPGLDYQHKRAI